MKYCKLYISLTLFSLSPDLIGANDIVHILDVFRVSGLSPFMSKYPLRSQWKKLSFDE